MRIFKILLLAFVLFGLSSCGGDSSSSGEETGSSEVSQEGEITQKSGVRHFPGKDFSMKVPAAWNIITENKDAIPSPKNGTVELAITSTETQGGFANNLVILSQDLDKYISSREYSIINNVGAENEYVNYVKLAGKEFSFDDGESSMIYVFEAKYSPSTPVLKFVQTAYACDGKKAFFLTIALPVSLKDTSKYEKLLGTFECK